MIPKPPITIATDRLLLQAARRDHVASLFAEYTGRPEAAHFLPRGVHASQSKTEAMIDAWGEAGWAKDCGEGGQRFAWSIIEREAARPVGLFLLIIDGGHGEIHYGIGPDFWGRGLVAEAGRAVMGWIVEQSSISSVGTICPVSHAASMRVLEKIGLQRGQLIPEALVFRSGMRMDGWSYGWERCERSM